MKILMLVRLLPPAEVGGAERQCLRQARALAARGHPVTVLTQWVDARSPRRETRHGITILRFGFLLPMTYAARRLHDWLVERRGVRAVRPDPERKESLGAAVHPAKRFRWMALAERPGVWSFLYEIQKAVRRGLITVEVVHAHESLWIAGVAQWVAEALGVPVFCKEAFLPVLLFPSARDVPRAEEWRTRRLNCRFIAMTSAIADELESQGISRRRIVTIPNGIEIPSVMADPGKHSSGLYVGNFSQGAAHKAFDVLLRAWGEAVAIEPGMRLRLCGGGDTTAWREYAAQCGCGDSVVFEGPVADVSSLHRQSGFLVLPSRQEGMSNALLEAMASGLPAVVTAIPGNTALIQDGVNGLVVPVGDAGALAQAMVTMYRSARLREELGRAARERVATEYEIGRIAEQLEQTYRKAVDEDHRAVSGVDFAAPNSHSEPPMSP